jgi:hypothetical protein
VDRDRDKLMGRGTGGQRNWWTEEKVDRGTGGQGRDKLMGRGTGGQRNWWTEEHVDRGTGGQGQGY